MPVFLFMYIIIIMVKINLAKTGFNTAKELSAISTQLLVIAQFAADNSKEFKSVDKFLDSKLSAEIKAEDFKFDIGSTLLVKTREKIQKVLLVGLGDKSKFDLKSERKAIASALRAAKAEKVEEISFRTIERAELIAEAGILLNYEFLKYKTQDKDKNKGKKLKEINILVEDNPSRATKAAIERAEITAQATNKARDLVWEPACEVTPSYLARVALAIKGVTVKVMGQAECKKLGMGSYLAVSQGSDEPPKFIELTYTAKNYKAGKSKHIAIVGKGVTFDSGGLSLKPAKSMEMMKEDMSGAASVLGVMTALGELKPENIKITGIIAATENMPSGKAYRPGDVIIAMNGKTIEVNNTDAEGRLTLADAVAYVSKKNPDEIIDIATLTGACMTALGNQCAGLMTNNQDLLDRVKTCADRQGELMWQLPLYDEYKARLKSDIADLKNAGSGGQAGAQNGGLFIQEFIGNKPKTGKKASDEQIPWLHIDIAGPCWLEEANDWSPSGASGMPTRTLLDYILS